MLARLVGRSVLRSAPCLVRSAVPVIGVERVREQPNKLLQLAGGAALLSAAFAGSNEALSLRGLQHGLRATEQHRRRAGAGCGARGRARGVLRTCAQGCCNAGTGLTGD